MKTRSLRLAAWKIKRKPWRNFKQCNQTYLHVQETRFNCRFWKLAWNKWVSWCCQQQIHPVYVPLTEILNCLSTLFEKGLQYRTINSYRSAISGYHDHVDGKLVGKRPRICALLKCLQSKATTTSLNICLGCWNSFDLFQNNYVW